MAKANKQQWGVYGYAASRNISAKEITELPNIDQAFKSGLNIPETIKLGDIVYIGIDREINTQRRHREHTSPSTFDEGGINFILQMLPPETFKYFVLAELHIDSKELAYLIETNSINEFDPTFNRKKRQ